MAAAGRDAKKKLPALFLLVLLPGAVLAQAGTDPVLARANGVEVRLSDYEFELLRLPEAQRHGFATDRKRVADLVNRLLLRRILAAKAESEGLTRDPKYLQTLKREMEKFWGEAYLADVAAAAERRFDANASANERRARELYTIDLASRWTQPESVSVTHVLFDVKKRSDGEARKLAVQARERALAGDDFSALAREMSDDPSAKRNSGRLNGMERGRLDPAFAEAAFALQNPGDFSLPVRSAHGWHVIRLEGRDPRRVVPYENARKQILDGMKLEAVNAAKNEALAAAQHDPSIQFEEPAIAELMKPGPLQQGDPLPAPRSGD